MQKIEFKNKVMDAFNLENSSLYEPEIDDLWFLYSLIRDKCVTSILEYGSGWSTFVMAIALQENFLDFGLEHAQIIRHPNPFRFMTIDASSKYQDSAMNRIPVDSKKYIANYRYTKSN